MNFKKLSVFLLVIFLMYSCSNNFLTVDNSPFSNNGESITEAEPLVSIDNDRGIAVFVDENNVTIDIESFDEESNSFIKCIEPFNLALIKTEDDFGRSALETDSVRAFVIGRREDGKPGIWLIHKSGKVQCPINEETGKRTSHLLDADNNDGDLIGGEYEGFLGWTYFPTIFSDDKHLIGGYALNEDGFNRRFIQIEAGSQVAVYWRLKESVSGYYYISRAKVIGTLPENDNPGDWFYRWIRKIISRLKLLFLSRLDDYLIEPNMITFDESLKHYEVLGPNKNGNDSVALVDYYKVYSIVEVTTSENEAPFDIIGPSEQTIVYDFDVPTEIQLVTGEPENAFDPNPGDIVTFYSSTLPEGVTLDPESGILTVLNPPYGNYSEEFTVWSEDDKFLKSTDFTVTIYFTTSS